LTVEESYEDRCYDILNRHHRFQLQPLEDEAANSDDSPKSWTPILWRPPIRLQQHQQQQTLPTHHADRRLVTSPLLSTPVELLRTSRSDRIIGCASSIGCRSLPCQPLSYTASPSSFPQSTASPHAATSLCRTASPDGAEGVHYKPPNVEGGSRRAPSPDESFNDEYDVENSTENDVIDDDDTTNVMTRSSDQLMQRTWTPSSADRDPCGDDISTASVSLLERRSTFASSSLSSTATLKFSIDAILSPRFARQSSTG